MVSISQKVYQVIIKIFRLSVLILFVIDKYPFMFCSRFIILTKAILYLNLYLHSSLSKSLTYLDFAVS